MPSQGKSWDFSDSSSDGSSSGNEDQTRWYWVQFPPYIQRIDSFTDHRGANFHKQVAKARPETKKISVAFTPEYAPVEVIPDIARLQVHGLQPLPNGSTQKVTLMRRVPPRTYRFWPPAHPSQNVLPHYWARADPNQPLESRAELSSVPLPTPPMNWIQKIVHTPKHPEEVKRPIRRSSIKGRKIELGPIRIGDAIGEADEEDTGESGEEEDESLLGAVGGSNDPRHSVLEKPKKNKKMMSRKVIRVRNQRRPTDEVLVNVKHSPRFDSVFRDRTHGASTVLRRDQQKETINEEDEEDEEDAEDAEGAEGAESSGSNGQIVTQVGVDGQPTDEATARFLNLIVMLILLMFLKMARSTQ